MYSELSFLTRWLKIRFSTEQPWISNHRLLFLSYEV